MTKARTVLAAIVAIPAVAVAGLYIVSWLRNTPIEQAPFFDQRAGDHDPLVVAHQGGEALRPSNTMIAFGHAAEIGADVLDTDMHLTADGIPVLIHDETVDRTSDGSGAVRDLTLAELRTLDFGYSFSPDGGETFPNRGQGHGIVTVEELFAEFPDHRFGIEIKQTTAGAATTLCRLIRRFGYQNQVLISSFGKPNMDAFRQTCPEVATSATEDEVRSFYILHRLGLTGLSSPDYQSFQVPEYSGDTHVLTEGFVADARARGLPIVPWTINGSDDLARMIALDVDGINTDHPDRLIELITAG